MTADCARSIVLACNGSKWVGSAFVSRASRTLRGATQVVSFCLSVTKKFFVRGPIDTPPHLQAGLTDLDEIWHNGRS